MSASFSMDVAQVLEFVGIDREEAAEHHRLRRTEARQRFGAGLLLERDGVADAGVADLLDRGIEIADLAGPQFVHGGHDGAVDADIVHVVGAARLHHADAITLLQDPVDDADDTDHAEVLVVLGVHQHRLQRRVAGSLGRGQVVDDGLQHLTDALPGLGGNGDGTRGIDADHVFHLLGHAGDVGGGQVDLVEDRHDLVVGVDGLVDVGERLRLHPLRRIDHQQRPFDGAHGAADLVGKVDMAGRVDEVQQVLLAVERGVVEPDRVGLDGDAPLPLDIHGVEQLLLHVAGADGVGGLDQAIGQRGLAVVDMRHDGEVADMAERSHGRGYAAERGPGQWAGVAGRIVFLGIGGYAPMCTVARGTSMIRLLSNHIAAMTEMPEPQKVLDRAGGNPEAAMKVDEGALSEMLHG